MLRSEEVVMKLNFLVSSIFLGSALILGLWQPQMISKKEIDKHPKKRLKRLKN